MHVALQPAANRQARKHYRDTVESPVPLTRIRPHLGPEVFAQLEDLYPTGEAWLWGATPGSLSQMRRMEVGDLVLFYRDFAFFSRSRVTLIDMSNQSLALDLWERSHRGDPYLHIFFLEEPEDFRLSYRDLWQVAQFGPEDQLRGLTVLPQEESDRVLQAFFLDQQEGRDPVQDSAAARAEESLESGQGFPSSAAVRKAVEDHSMQRAEEFFQGLDFATHDVSATHPYDLRCEQGDLTIHVEVKGTQTRGEQVILTKNEVEFARKHADRMVLFIQHSVDVTESDDGDPVADGGKRLVHMPWNVDAGDLTTINYRYSVPAK